MSTSQKLQQRRHIAAVLARPRIALIDETSGSAKLSAIMHDEGALASAIASAQADLERSYTRLGAGGQRIAYRGPGCVFKLPRVTRPFRMYLAGPDQYLKHFIHPLELGDFAPSENARANLSEVWSYEVGAMRMPLAPCRLAWHKSGIPIVVMERLSQRKKNGRPEGPDEDAWNEEYEQCQFGWSALLGSWAGYDAGLPPVRANMDEIEWNRHLRRRRTAALRSLGLLQAA